MALYLARWEINIEADSPTEAAEKALEIQRDPNSIAVVFEVFDAEQQRTLVDVAGPGMESL